MGEISQERIGNYELISLIGDGAQGRVYRARCAVDTLPYVKKGEEVALKFVRISGDDEKIRLRFQAQAEILRQLTHENIVSYRDSFSWQAGEWDEAQCLVMELLDGEPLSALLERAKNGLPWPQVADIFGQCLSGLIYAREQGITHRDIKPSNIFITKSGKAKLVDFDIACRDDSVQMSTAGWKGTFDYMAPDFLTITGFRGDEISDIFSFGVCFYQALTGVLPYESLGGTAQVGYLNRWRTTTMPAPSFRSGIFRVLNNAKTLASKCLSVHREERYQTFTSMLDDFRSIHYRRIRHKNKDEYELTGVLGRGGFGEVFKAVRVSDGMPVAVKYLFAEKQPERFLKEATILKQYPHPNLVKYVDFIMIQGAADEKQYFLVMEYLEGMPGWTLRSRMKSAGRLEVAEAVPLFSGYLSALQFLHSSARPIIHRDIKPGNLYAPLGHPEKGKIFDLGVARDVTGTATVGGVPGTLDYMAPEFTTGGADRGSPQTDIYALGLCLYEALAGKPVFARLPSDLNAAWFAFQDRLRNPPPPDFSAEVFTRYPRLAQLIGRALAQKPEDRFRTAAEMRAALEDAVRPASAPSAPHPAADEDEGEVTMATFAGTHGTTAHADVTTGTRPIEAVEGGLDQLALARDRREKKSRNKSRLIALGAAAAAVALLGGGGLWLSLSGRGDKRPEVTSTAQEKAPEPEPRKPEAPAPLPPESDPVYQELQKAIPSAVSSEADLAAAEKAATRLGVQAAAAWAGLDEAEKSKRLETLRASLKARVCAYLDVQRDAALASYAAGKDGRQAYEQLTAFPGRAPQVKALVGDAYEKALAPVETARLGYLAAGVIALLPAQIEKAADGATLQKLTAALLKAEATSGVRLEPKKVRAVEQALAAKYTALAQGFATRAQSLFEAGRMTEGEVEQARLSELADAVEARFGKEAVAALARQVQSSRKTAQAKAAQAAADRTQRLAKLAGSLDALLGQAAKGDLTGCAEGFALVASVTPDDLSDGAVKTKWEAVREACLTLIDKTLKQTDPLDQREKRLSAVSAVLSHAAAPALFAEKAAALKKALDEQAAICVLRVSNQSGTRVQIAGGERLGNADLAAAASQDWKVSVPKEPQPVSVTVDGGKRFRPRTEKILLRRSAGIEHVIVKLEEVPEKTDVATAEPKPADKPKPAEPSAPTPATPGAPSGTGLFELSVTPKTAVITVDDQPVEGSTVTVEADKNHKVVATCPGYKQAPQYYRVRPGETKRIDIMLEKESRRSLFRR